MSQRAKTLRAFGAYLELMDTAEMIRDPLRGQLWGFDLTIRGFRLLEILYRQKNGHGGLLRLTPEGEKFVGTIFPKHAKVVKCLMRVLDGREQKTLRRLLAKLRAGDPVKFWKELQMWGDAEMNLQGERVKRR
jgi:hypothetical protein